MPTDKVIDLIEKTLERANQAYPSQDMLDARNFFGDDPTKEERALFEEAIKIAFTEKLIEPGKNDDTLARITPFGRDVIREGNYRALLEMRKQKEQHSYNVQYLEFERLQGEVNKIQRENKFWKVAAVAGAVAFIIEVINFFAELLN